MIPDSNSNLWRVTGASVTGQHHVIQQQPCQDAWHARVDGEWLIAAVADGASNASMGREGAAHIVHALSSFLRKCLTTAADNSGFDNEEFSDYWAAQIKAAIAIARNQLTDGRLHKKLKVPTVNNADLHDFHASIVGVVCNAGRGLIFHLGDGFAAAVNDSWSPAEAVSEPEHSPNGNEAFFYTQADWLQHLRFTELTSLPKSLWLMTGGTAAFASDGKSTGLDQKFTESIHGYFSETEDPTLRSKTMEKALNTEFAQRITNEDKTLLWCSPCAV